MLHTSHDMNLFRSCDNIVMEHWSQPGKTFSDTVTAYKDVKGAEVNYQVYINREGYHWFLLLQMEGSTLYMVVGGDVYGDGGRCRWGGE